MKYSNPTLIRLGMTGDFFGKHYRVAGRVVLGVTEGGEIYYWNEFNLIDAQGELSTLVFEVTDQGPEWRLFTPFEPRNPMSAEAAASKRVGDRVDLDGTAARVTMVSQSRIYHIEGAGSEGEEVGDVANYFNLETESLLMVVSWTGTEVECFRGANVSAAAVKRSFNLATVVSGDLSKSLGPPFDSAASRIWLKLVGAFFALVVLAVGYSIWNSKHSAAPVRRFVAPRSPLRVGSSGMLDGRRYLVRAHGLVESAQVGLRSERHEYQLTDPEGGEALLVHGWKPGAEDWVLFKPFQPSVALTPAEAATKRTGETIAVGDYVVTISGLCQETIRQVESAEATGSGSGTVRYGFSGQVGATAVLVRWGEKEISFHAGEVIRSTAVTTGFSPLVN